MPRKTNFEQVPLEVVKKILEEQVRREEMSASGGGIKKRELGELQQLLLATSRANGKGEEK